MKIPLLFPLTFLALISSTDCFAQKIPNKQDVSVWLPNDVKIDGNSIEWKHQFQAYNKGVQAYYTLANDDKQLYLTINATNDRIIEKILESGITFSVTGNKKDQKNNPTVLFPLMELVRAYSIFTSAGKTTTAGVSLIGVSKKDSSDLNNKNASLTRANASLAVYLKEIKVNGIPTVTDTVAGITPKTRYYNRLPLWDYYYKVIPINNKDGIEAYIQFEKDGSLTYELAMPLKYIKGFDSEKKIIYYHITFNGRGYNRQGNHVSYSPPPDQHILDLDLQSDTDFRGEYTLAKKP